MRHLTRLATTNDPPRTEPSSDTTSPLTPEGPLALSVSGVRCTAGRPRSRRVFSPAPYQQVTSVRHLPASVEAGRPYHPFKGTPLPTPAGRLHAAHIAAGDPVPSVRRCKRTTTAQAPCTPRRKTSAPLQCHSTTTMPIHTSDATPGTAMRCNDTAAIPFHNPTVLTKRC